MFSEPERTQLLILRKKKHPSLQAKSRNLPAPLPLRIKFADDTALVSLLQGKEDNHRLILGQFTLCCDASDLLITFKTKQMWVYFFGKKNLMCVTTVKGEPI